MSIDDRCKEYELLNDKKLYRKLPVLARLDGRAFHTFTRGLERPFCKELSQCMTFVCEELMKEFHPLVIYTQSDKISLLWYFSEDFEKETKILFSGRQQKIASVLAGFASSIFTEAKYKYLPQKKGKIASFDGRVWQVPTIGDMVEYFVWRESDAIKNSIAMAAQSMYSHKELHKKNQSDMQEMMFQKGTNWNSFPAAQKRGTWFKKRLYKIKALNKRSNVEEESIRSKIVQVYPDFHSFAPQTKEDFLLLKDVTEGMVNNIYSE